MAILMLTLIVLVACAQSKSVHQGSGCRTSDNEVLRYNEEKLYIYPRKCTILKCVDNEIERLDADCPSPQCVNPERKTGACCQHCPQGPNCRLPTTGEVIQADEPYVNGTMRCSCPTLPSQDLGWGMNLTTAVCRNEDDSVTTTTTTAVTEMGNGTRNATVIYVDLFTFLRILMYHMTGHFFSPTGTVPRKETTQADGTKDDAKVTEPKPDVKKGGYPSHGRGSWGGGRGWGYGGHGGHGHHGGRRCRGHRRG